MFIQKPDNLQNFIEDIGTPTYLAVDTEFISEKTYYPKQCLIQIAYESYAAVIDTLCDLDLSPLIKLLNDQNIIKVLHAAEQDLAILCRLTFSKVDTFWTLAPVTR